MSELAHRNGAGKGIADAWSGLLAPWSQLIPDLPSLAPGRLYQNILSSLISGGHFSLIATTVNQQATKAPELEEEIVTKVASYGKQLGRLIDAVDVLAERARPEVTDEEDRLALDELSSLAEKIGTAREQYAKDHVEQILKSIAQLGRPDHVDHDALQQIRVLVDRLDRQP